MPNHPEYACTECGTPTSRERLMVKKVSFMEMGEGGRMMRSRVAGWLCPKCVANDPHWQQEKFHPPRPSRPELRFITTEKLSG